MADCELLMYTVSAMRYILSLPVCFQEMVDCIAGAGMNMECVEQGTQTMFSFLLLWNFTLRVSC